MNTEELQVYSDFFFNLSARTLISATSRPLYHPGKKPSVHCTEGWVGPTAGLDTPR